VSSARTDLTDEYSTEYHVYEPHRVGLPKMVPYFREMWRRRSFATELARTRMHAANTDTVLGQAWLILNPLLLACVYFILVDIIGRGAAKGPDFFALLTSGLFLYYYIIGAMTGGATSVTQGGRLILNTPFPKMLLTVSTVYMSFRRYLPTLLVYAVLHTWAQLPVGPQLLWMVPIWMLSTMFALGLANIFATLQVYFRDTASFLPYFVRIWLYLSPVLWTIDMARGSERLQVLSRFAWLNPLYAIFGAQGQVLHDGRAPDASLMIEATVWSVATLIFGSLLFMSREREFAVRL
jgi:teichoic acid transport system permease protein